MGFQWIYWDLVGIYDQQNDILGYPPVSSHEAAVKVYSWENHLWMVFFQLAMFDDGELVWFVGLFSYSWLFVGWKW